MANNAPNFSNTYLITAIVSGNDLQYKGSVIGTVSIKVNRFSKNKQYQVSFYRGASLLETIPVTSLTAIFASDYPVNPNTGKACRWHSNAIGGVFNKGSLVVADFNLYAQEVAASFEMIIENRIIPTDLVNYGKMSEEIFSNYISGATVISRYVTPSGNNDGSSWANASGDIQAVIDGIGDANENRVYVVLIAYGTYKPDASYVIKNHVALVGGFTVGSYDRVEETRLDGNNDKRLFDNNGNGLDNTVFLYGVVVTNGNVGWAQNGGGMNNNSSSPTLINVTFSGNKADEDGGGIYHNGDGQPLTLINMILWEDNNGQIYLNNNNSDTETVNLYYSGIYQGIDASFTADGIRLDSDDTNVYPISINSEAVITNDPGLGTLANHGGEVDAIPIDSNSPVKNKGIYVRGVKSEIENLYPASNLYYSENNTDWFSDPSLTIQKSPPNDADDLTTTDARGYGRVGRPDMGAYEVGSTP